MSYLGNEETLVELPAIEYLEKKLGYNFIHGKITIESLAVERGRRSGAVTQYEQSRVELHNSILLLEMLTNVKIIKD